MTRKDLHLIAWDFDGVLNDGFREGRAIWADNFERDLGHPISFFRDHFFGERFEAVVTGREDLREAVAGWAEQVGFPHGPDTVIRYWFEQDRHPVAAMLDRLERLKERGIRQVIATNNEAHRARFIEEEMGYGARVETVFASGRMGVRKPDPGFFHHIVAETGVAPGNIILIDDLEENIEAAREAGWQGYHLADIHENDLDEVLGLTR